ncbi:MAG TPA: DUF58 domain-containing protein [Actinomycetota bacterium]|nr:DUF58 domain-containing protein [Actinomycetota bacterium]
MPTRRGLLIASAGVALLVTGIVFGSRAVQQLGFALIALLLIGIAVVRISRHDLAVHRQIAPQRARAHHPVTITLSIENFGRGRAPLIMLEDRLPPGLAGRARFLLPSLESGGKREAPITVRPEQRGRYKVGPLEVEAADPFGLARVRSVALGTSEFVVHPRIESLVMPRDSGERRSTARATTRHATGPRGEDFYTIREYVEGDDLRKIHWASTAKRAKAMIRHEETPWQTRATIVLDDRRLPYGGFSEHISFERAVSAAASLVDLYARAGYGYQLIGAHHPGIPSGKGEDHFNRCLDLLATIEPKGNPKQEDPLLLARLTELEARRGGEASLVIVTGSLDPTVGVAIARLRRVYHQIILVAFPSHRFGTATTSARWEGERAAREVAALITRAGGRVLVLGPGDRFAPAWASFSSRTATSEMRWDLKPEHV